MLHLEIHAPPAQNNPLELAVGALRDPRPLLFALGESLLHSTRERFARQHSPEGVPWQVAIHSANRWLNCAWAIRLSLPSAR